MLATTEANACFTFTDVRLDDGGGIFESVTSHASDSEIQNVAAIVDGVETVTYFSSRIIHSNNPVYAVV